ncbi:8928_t:CDS:2 [Gigaspora margarita]|uniref:8928_t:CDS:1 n=1 Tax=Gigaspora margarita TaxID=4874 RepID=A0ABN7WGY0_GIGMA|nr:8928_t:CDS:2 [Gigaspora margarita]
MNLKNTRYSSQQVDKNRAFEFENKDESLNTSFAKDTIDVPLILLKELIPTNRYNNIVEIWELGSSDAALHTESCLEMPYKTVNISYEHIYNSLNQQKEYATTNGLSKKAIQLGLNVGPSVIKELNNFMKDFITKHIPKQNASKHNTPKHNIPKQNQKSSDESDSIDCSDSNYDDELDESVPQNIENIDPSSI